MSILGDLSQDILDNEFDGDTDVASATAISGWLEANLGRLNSLIYTNFSGSGADLDLEAQSIHKELYLYHHYSKQARNSLRGITRATGEILSISDGNNSISFVNRNEVSKVYRGLANDSQERVNQLAAHYNIYQAEPLQVGGIEGEFYTGQV
tara:strand:- start:3357 stop:3812 length:456 start_codon:yes stop_codon:yes gene_type:complete